MFLFHVNIRSVIRNEDDLIKMISAMRFPPEIIAITETQLQANRVFHSKLQGYICIRADSLTCAGGVAFLIKSTFNYQIRDDLNMFVPACENLWIAKAMRIDVTSRTQWSAHTRIPLTRMTS